MQTTGEPSFAGVSPTASSFCVGVVVAEGTHTARQAVFKMQQRSTIIAFFEKQGADIVESL